MKGRTIKPGASMRFNFLGRYHSALLSVFRAVVGLLFMQHGAQKLFGWFGGMGGSGATAELVSMMGLAGVLEFFGGLLIVVGLLTRPVALVLSALMVAAYFMAHAPQGSVPVVNGGQLALLFAITFLYLAAAGGGRWSVDAALGWEDGDEDESTAVLPRASRRVA